jgi:ABC-type glycerol-3-phosphate transport system substrate-binding protein
MFKQVWMYAALLSVVALILTACGAAATPAQVQVVVTAPPQVVEVTKVVAGTTVKETVVVEKNVVVTATPAPTANPFDENAPITVWIDQDRQPYIDAYLKAFPDKANLIKASIVDREQLPAKVLLFNNTNQGWPDVVFAEPRLVGRVADAAHDFPLDLKEFVPADTLKNYDGMAGCTFGPHVYCVRNDMAQFVLYYNKPLMDKFGYTVPTTFEELQDLSDRVAKEHPGYLLGTFGDGWTFISFFDASGCPSHELKDDNTLKIDMADPRCVRAAKLVDHMIANKTLWNTDFFDATFVKQQNDDKVLMVSMATWAWGVFNGTYYKTPDHQLGVAAPLKWKADAEAQTPAMGGAAWMVSRHTKNPKLAADLVVWLTTNEGLWSTIPNWPAYKPNQALFQKQVSSNAIFANDPFPVMQVAAGQITPLDKWPRFDLISPLTEVVKGAYQENATIESVLPQFADKFKPLAEAQGYQVVNK